MVFEQELPIWLAPGNDPSEEAKNSGWGMGQHPPADWFNWQWNRTYLALKEIQEKAASKDEISNVDLTPLETEINKLKQSTAAHQADNTSHNTYATCTTIGATSTKVITVTGFTLSEGVRITVKFNYANTANAPTLNINSTGAKSLLKPDGTVFKNIKAGVYSFVYDGTSFISQGEGASGNAVASDLLSGKTAGSDAGDLVGTMPNNGAVSIIPGLTSKPIPAGYHNGNGVVAAGYTVGSVVPYVKALEVFRLAWTKDTGSDYISETYATNDIVVFRRTGGISKMGIDGSGLASVKEITGLVSITMDGSKNIYYSNGTSIVKININGDVLWTYTPNDPEILSVGVVEVSRNGLYLYCLTSGRERDGSGGYNSVDYLKKINPSTGVLLNQKRLYGVSAHTVLPEENGDVYLSISTYDQLSEYKPDLSESYWSYYAEGVVSTIAPSIYNGVVYGGGTSYSVFKLNSATGALVSKSNSNGPYTIRVDPLGNLYFQHGNNLERRDESFVVRQSLYSGVRSQNLSNMSSDGYLYFGESAAGAKLKKLEQGFRIT